MKGKSKDGCGMSIKNVNNLEISDLFIDECISENNGAIYLIERIVNITIRNITITNSEAKQGVGFFINTFDNTKISIENVVFKNLTSHKFTGALYMKNSFSPILNIKIKHILMDNIIIPDTDAGLNI